MHVPGAIFVTMKKISLWTGAALFLLLILFSCKSNPDTAGGFDLMIRLPSEPENMHPMLTRSSYAVQITGHILFPLAEFDPVTLELSPMLIKEIPVAIPVKEGPHAGGRMYSMEIRPEAVWDNGSPVTGHDYLFTLKAASNPHISATAWDSFLSFITDVEVDSADAKKFTAYVDSTYILALEAATNFNIYPAHVYDPENIMSQFSLQDLRNDDMQWTPEQDELLKKFASAFESVTYYREIVEGSGPYKFDSWNTGENIRLTRKENWWGDRISDAPLSLKAYPQSITYRIITDAATAEAALKAGEIDVISEVPPASFMKIKNDPEWQDKFQFLTPEILQINYLELNNRDIVLSDKRIRQALAYSIDYDGLMENLLVGLGERATGPIHPLRKYFRKDIEPIEQDVNKAISLIREAGWEDTNANGTPDKMINGKREELQVTLKITNREEGQTMATIIKENAKRAGIDIVVETVDPSQFNQDVRQLNFDIAPLRTRPNPVMDDPYSTYFSSSDGNRSGFSHPQADEAILTIRTATSTSKRDSAYHDLQEIIFEEQPAIYLYVPVERIIASKKYKVITSSRKPGYFENLFEPAG